MMATSLPATAANSPHSIKNSNFPTNNNNNNTSVSSGAPTYPPPPPPPSFAFNQPSQNDLRPSIVDDSSSSNFLDAHEFVLNNGNDNITQHDNNNDDDDDDEFAARVDMPDDDDEDDDDENNENEGGNSTVTFPSSRPPPPRKPVPAELGIEEGDDDEVEKKSSPNKSSSKKNQKQQSSTSATNYQDPENLQRQMKQSFLQLNMALDTILHGMHQSSAAILRICKQREEAVHGAAHSCPHTAQRKMLMMMLKGKTFNNINNNSESSCPDNDPAHRHGQSPNFSDFAAPNFSPHNAYASVAATMLSVISSEAIQEHSRKQRKVISFLKKGVEDALESWDNEDEGDGQDENKNGKSTKKNKKTRDPTTNSSTSSSSSSQNEFFSDKIEQKLKTLEHRIFSHLVTSSDLALGATLNTLKELCGDTITKALRSQIPTTTTTTTAPRPTKTTGQNINTNNNNNIGAEQNDNTRLHNNNNNNVLLPLGPSGRGSNQASKNSTPKNNVATPNSSKNNNKNNTNLNIMNSNYVKKASSFNNNSFSGSHYTANTDTDGDNCSEHTALHNYNHFRNNSNTNDNNNKNGNDDDDEDGDAEECYDERNNAEPNQQNEINPSSLTFANPTDGSRVPNASNTNNNNNLATTNKNGTQKFVSGATSYNIINHSNSAVNKFHQSSGNASGLASAGVSNIVSSCSSPTNHNSSSFIFQQDGFNSKNNNNSRANEKNATQTAATAGGGAADRILQNLRGLKISNRNNNCNNADEVAIEENDDNSNTVQPFVANAMG